MSKADFLKECMRDVSAVSLDEFQRSTCVRCINDECGRSAANNMLFNIRANTWKQVLFDNVPRAENNPSGGPYSKFVPADASQSGPVPNFQSMEPDKPNSGEIGSKAQLDGRNNETEDQSDSKASAQSGPVQYNTPMKSLVIDGAPGPKNDADSNTVVFDDE